MYSENPNPFALNSPTLPIRDIPVYKRIYYIFGKITNFIFRYKNNLPYLFRYLLYIVQDSYKEDVQFMSDKDFIEAAKTRSTLRLQDGEFTLMLGTRGISDQEKDLALVSMWKEAIKNYRKDSPYLLGIPPYIVIDNKSLHKERFKYLWMPSKILYRMWFNKNVPYFNGSYFYIKNTSIPFMQTLSAQHDVILVSNRDTIKAVKQRASIFFKDASSVMYVETPKVNAFSVYNQIKTNVESKITEKTVVFVACGAAGKALIYDLSQRNIVAHDIGWGLTGAYTGEEREHFLKWDVFGPLYYKATKNE